MVTSTSHLPTAGVAPEPAPAPASTRLDARSSCPICGARLSRGARLRKALYEFDGYRLDPARRRLEKLDGSPLRISTKAFDALVHFVEHPGELVPRAALMAALWPETVVEENNLSQAIAALRRSLGGECIVTLPGRGYQFVADVRVREPVTVAVMPFDDLSADGDGAVVCDGLAEEVVDKLARVPNLRVTARAPIHALRDAELGTRGLAAALGVAYVVEGSVAGNGARLRLRVRFSDASGFSLWAETYDREPADLLEVQSELASAVASAIERALS